MINISTALLFSLNGRVKIKIQTKMYASFDVKRFNLFVMQYNIIIMYVQFGGNDAVDYKNEYNILKDSMAGGD